MDDLKRRHVAVAHDDGDVPQTFSVLVLQTQITMDTNTSYNLATLSPFRLDGLFSVIFLTSFVAT